MPEAGTTWSTATTSMALRGIPGNRRVVGVLDHGDPAPLLDRQQPGGPVVERPREDHADDPGPVPPRGGPEQRVDRRPDPVLAGPSREPDRRPDGSGGDGPAGPRRSGRARSPRRPRRGSAGSGPLRERIWGRTLAAVRGDVQRHEDRGRQVGRQRPDQLGQRLHAPRRGPDGDDVMSRHRLIPGRDRGRSRPDRRAGTGCRSCPSIGHPSVPATSIGRAVADPRRPESVPRRPDRPARTASPIDLADARSRQRPWRPGSGIDKAADTPIAFR